VNQNSNSIVEDTAVGTESKDFTAHDALSEILRTGAQKMLKAAIEKEVSDYVNDRTDIVDENGRRLVVRNGSLPEREILTGVGDRPYVDSIVSEMQDQSGGLRDLIELVILSKAFRHN
jgi:hypothetical protein